MILSLAPYQLNLKPGWSRQHLGKGALLRLEDHEKNFGYADLHPWESLQDASIDQQIILLKEGKTTELMQRSLDMAYDDLIARKQKIKLISDSTLAGSIANHLLCMSLEAAHCELQQLSQQISRLPTLIKVKVSNSFESELKLLLGLLKDYPAVKWRLDFNAAYTYTEFLKLWTAIPASLQTQIEFCEDPIPWHLQEWKQLAALGVPLAADQCFAELIGKYDFVKNLIVKSAKINSKHLFASVDLQNWVKVNSIQLVVTSYLDHPVGIRHALVVAQDLKNRFANQLGACGLNSMRAYQDDTASEFNSILSFNQGNPKLVHRNEFEINEFGIGFTSALERQTWNFCTNVAL